MEVNPEDLSTLLLCTVRYSLGRMTYMSSLAWELIVRYQCDVSTANLVQIRKEIHEALQMVEGNKSHLGMVMDHKSWQEGLTAIDNILDTRKTLRPPFI